MEPIVWGLRDEVEFFPIKNAVCGVPLGMSASDCDGHYLVM